MGRKKKTAAANGPGHNSALSDDEQRALALHHVRLYQAADAQVEAAKAERKAVGDLAKHDLGKGALADIKDLIAAGDERATKAKLERALRLARWAGMPLGFTVDLFADRQPAEERWASDGKTAGMAGDVCQPPHHLSPSAQQIWISSWHEGQAVLASAFAKKREPAPEPDATDYGNTPFAAPAAP